MPFTVDNTVPNLTESSISINIIDYIFEQLCVEKLEKIETDLLYDESDESGF